MLAYYIDEVPSFISMPVELVELVLSHVDPIKLSAIEQLPELQEIKPSKLNYPLQ